MSSYQIRQRAEAQFHKLPGVKDDIIAQTEFEAAADALSAKIARLKELRLARDAAALAARPAVPVKKARGKMKQTKQIKRPALSLLDWMKNRLPAGNN
jgi:hypothetical protein